jgi:hypothetical protein
VVDCSLRNAWPLHSKEGADATCRSNRRTHTHGLYICLDVCLVNCSWLWLMPGKECADTTCYAGWGHASQSSWQSSLHRSSCMS